MPRTCMLDVSDEEFMKLFDGLGSESEGLWWAMKKRGVDKEWKYFHIRVDGSRAYSEEYDDAHSFHNGFAAVGRNNEEYEGREMFHIRPDGSRPYSQSYARADDFDELGYARVVRHDNTSCFVDGTGNEITFEEYRKKL